MFRQVRSKVWRKTRRENQESYGDVRITELAEIGGRRLLRICWVTTSEVLPIMLSKRAALLGTACLGINGVSGH